MNHHFILTCMALLLTGCMTAPSREEEPTSFFQLYEGAVPAAQTHALIDCLMDNFDRAHFISSNIHARQQRRANSYRVESLINSAVVVSADVRDDGKVELVESITGSGIYTAGERDAFVTCMKTVGVSAELRPLPLSTNNPGRKLAN